MELDESYTNQWREIENYFESKDFEEVNFGLDAESGGTDLDEALEALPDSIYGMMDFRKDDTELVVVYNPKDRTGGIEVKGDTSGLQEDISSYLDDLEDLLDSELEYLGRQD